MPQKNWDKYEVALLVEAYLKIHNDGADRVSALSELSRY